MNLALQEVIFARVHAHPVTVLILLTLRITCSYEPVIGFFVGDFSYDCGS